LNGDDTRRDWVVLLEAADEREGSTLERASFAKVVSSWAGPTPTILYSPDRYAVQVSVRAANPPLALSSAVALWKDALRRAGLPEWQLLRAEIVTREELRHELEAAAWAEVGAHARLEAPPRTEDLVADALIQRALRVSVSELPGRELFLDEVRRALVPDGRASATRAVLVVHVDRLDSVDPFGERPLPHDLLVEVTGRLRKMVRRGDILARVGPADFALLVPAGSVSDTEALGRRIVDRLGCPFPGEGQPLAVVTASVGVGTTSYQGDADHVLLMAEVAMMVARKAGGERHEHLAASPDSV
jgi:diguanylate cyclase (GGDEF)-like protein